MAIEAVSPSRFIKGEEKLSDPLDGSSNTDVNGPLGTIFSFHRRDASGACRDCEGELYEKFVACDAPDAGGTNTDSR